MPRSERANGAATEADLPVADLFTLLWDALADVLGTAATAAPLRRAARRATSRYPELTDLAIAREKLEYRYALPAAWANGDGSLALRELVDELRPLLIELTGDIVFRRLERIPALREQGIIPPEREEQP